MVIPLLLLINSTTTVPAIGLEPEQRLSFKLATSNGAKVNGGVLLASVGDVTRSSSGEFYYSQASDVEYPVRDLLVFVSPQKKTLAVAVVYSSEDISVQKESPLKFGADQLIARLIQPKSIAWTSSPRKPWNLGTTRPSGKPVKGTYATTSKGVAAEKWYAMQSSEDEDFDTKEEQDGNQLVTTEQQWEFQVVDTYLADGKSWKFHSSKLRVRKIQERVLVSVVNGQKSTERKVLMTFPEYRL